MTFYDKLNDIIDISRLPESVSTKAGWSAAFSLVDIDYSNQKNIIPSALMNFLLEKHKGNFIEISLGLPKLSSKLEFSGVDPITMEFTGDIFERFCSTNNLRYYFVSKIADGGPYIILTPDEYLIIISNKEASVSDEIAKLCQDISECIFSLNETDFTSDEFNNFSRIFKESRCKSEQ